LIVIDWRLLPVEAAIVLWLMAAALATLALEKLLNTVLVVVVQVCAELYRLVPAIEMLNVGVAAVSLAIDRQDGPAGGAWEFVMTVATLPVVVVRSFAVSWIITLAELAGYRPCRVLQAAGHFSTSCLGAWLNAASVSW
jgi:hypothetical protein